MPRPAVLLLVLALAACGPAPLRDVDRTAFPTRLGLAEAEAAILRAGTNLGWEVTPLAPGRVRATLGVRRAHARVEVAFDAEGFRIIQAEGENLPGALRDDANAWVGTLAREIRREAGGG